MGKSVDDTKRTFLIAPHMSAFGGKADASKSTICGRGCRMGDRKIALAGCVGNECDQDCVARNSFENSSRSEAETSDTAQ